MDLIERLEWLFTGGVLGFIVGYGVAKLRDIKEELDEVNHDVKQIRDERGVVSESLASRIALFLVVLITLYAAVLSQVASNRSNNTADRVIDIQKAQKQNLDCTTQVLFDTVRALSERTTYSTAQADANIDVLKGQLVFLKGLIIPGLSHDEAMSVYTTYVAKVTGDIKLAEKTKHSQIQNPYPTVQDLTTCLAQTNENTKEPSGGSS